ncbi:hypothetical protein OEZ74_26190 [Leclercia adecarboxylata]|nr:hypothetical protein [Leclercia adecarboxylata]MDC6657767.1 hypothetical protein [Leclercia adecarboxylata]
MKRKCPLAGEVERLVSTLNYGETADDLDNRLAPDPYTHLALPTKA